MLLTLQREPQTARSTPGILCVDATFECFTLEDISRPKKIKHETCIAKGRYEIVINWSNRFERYLPLLLNVPEFTGIRIHAGNTAADTSGCILVGRVRGVDQIGESRQAFAAIFAKLQRASKREKIYVEIV